VRQDRIPRVKIKIGESWGGNERRDLADPARPGLGLRLRAADAERYRRP
jgi:hypothetical protein